jgi:hypothetical protein
MTAVPAKPELVGSNRLPVLASSINEHLAAAEAATRRGLEHAIAAGTLLIEAKELVDHGEWLPWLQANCRIGERQARTYMRLARNRHRLKSAVAADLTIAAAEALVGRPKPECPHGLPGQLDLLGRPEVPPCSAIVPAASPVRDRAVLHLIADLEQALTVVTQEADPGWYTQRRAKKLRRSGLRAAASTIKAAIAYLRERAT